MTVFQQLHQPTGRLIAKDGEQYLFFGGTAYLGLLDSPDYIRLYKEGIDKYGLNNGTSRSNNVQLGVYDEAEQFMAQRFGFESTALLSSGYLAAQVAVRALSEGREVMYAPDSHPALWLDRIPTGHGSFKSWCKEIIAYINSSSQSEFLIVSNTLDNLTPESYDFSPFAELCDTNKNLLFILDDSHGIGVINKDAVSIDLNWADHCPNIEVFLVASLAKGMGTDAGVVMGKDRSVRQIKAHPIFRGASPPSPAAIYALIHSLEVYQQAFDRLHHNIDSFSDLLKDDVGLSTMARFPVFTSRDAHLYRHLLHHHILVSSFPYPLSHSPLLNRIVISALHRQEDLEYLADVYFLKNQ